MKSWAFEKTRKETAKELLKRLELGPSFTSIARDFDAIEASAQFRLFSQSWILSDLCRLIPELRDNLDVFGQYMPKGQSK